MYNYRRIGAIVTDPLTQIDQVRERALAELEAVKTTADLEPFRIKYLGSKGEVKNLSDLIAAAPKEQKRDVGQKANAAKAEVTAAYEAKKLQLASGATADVTEDVTEPGKRPAIGNRHILMKVTDELTELFGRMGFSVASGPELEDEFHNFVALNIPKSHPARDPLDNYYVTVETGEEKAPGLHSDHQHLLRTQTSTVQIRVMENQKPPIRVVIPGRVYRPDTHDETHLSMFHQLEALVVDENVTMVDLKSTIMQFVHAYFGKDTKVRFRPSFFPFTEPSAEVDVWFEDKQRWVELGGCGMVTPTFSKPAISTRKNTPGWAVRVRHRAHRHAQVRDQRHPLLRRERRRFSSSSRPGLASFAR
jgi:phenylalanyl-tRNA synthetase alpha chain